MSNKSVAVAMIVKNEEALLARCLESVKGLPLYILDTGSQDRTVEIARQYTDNVFLDFVWIDDFSAAQNHIKAKVKEPWILSIDADEVLMCPIEDVIAAAQLGKDMVHVTMVAEGEHPNTFGFGRLFRNSPEIFWCQSVHKHLSVPGTGEEVGHVKIMYGRSPTHDQDPDREHRMLLATVAREKNPIRNLYYLGRSHFYRQEYQKALDVFNRYKKVAHWEAELADALLISAECHLQLKDVGAAADSLLQAIKINPNFKEAIEMMVAINTPEGAFQWKRMARAATNEDVLWKRTHAEPVNDIILIAPHNDDETLFAAYTCMRVKPLVIVVTDSFIQPERGDVGCDAETRRQETIAAMKIAGCPVVFLGIKDTELTEEILIERLKGFNPARAYVPAIQGGNAQHDIVGKVGLDLWGDRCERYTTYTKTKLYTKGNYEIKPTREECRLKGEMINRYKSQLNLPSTLPHFQAVHLNMDEWKSEWLL